MTEDNRHDIDADAEETRQARSLLAVAFETVPADSAAVGSDLLRGVRVLRARRRRTRSLMSAGAVVAAAGVAVAVVLSVTVAAAPPALAAVTGALSRASSQSFQMDLTVTQTQHEPFPGYENLKSPMHITGELDLQRNLGIETLSNGWQTRVVGGYAYTKVLPGSREAKNQGGKLWGSAPLEDQITPYDSAGGRLAWDVNSDQPFNPQALLALVRSSATVTDGGPVSGPGWTGTQYRFSLWHPGGTGGLVDHITGTIDVDHQGNIRSLFQTTAFARGDRKGNPGPGTGTVYTFNFTFSDFGVRFSVTPPPASQTDPDTLFAVQF